MSVGRSVSVCALAAGESSFGAVRVADDGCRRGRRGLAGAAGDAQRPPGRPRSAAGTRIRLLHLLVLRMGAAARRVSSTMTLRWSRTTWSDRRAVFRMPPIASKIARSSAGSALSFERVFDQQLEAGDGHRLIERNERAAVGHVQQLDPGALLERPARIDDDHRVAAEGRQFRRRMRPIGQHRLREPDDGAAQIGIERGQRLEHVIGQRQRDRAGRRGELARPPPARSGRCDDRSGGQMISMRLSETTRNYNVIMIRALHRGR